MERNYTGVGKSEGIDKAVLDQEIDALEWQEFVNGKSEAFAPAYVINDAIFNLKIPNVSHYAISKHGIDGMGLVGIRGHYNNGRADIYILDVGVHATVMATDFYPVLEECDISHLIPLTADPDHTRKQENNINKLIQRGMIDCVDVLEANHDRN